MISFSFDLINPWWNYRWDIIWGAAKLLTKHKAIEFNVYRSVYILEISFFIKTMCDHAGMRIMLGLFSFNIELYLYDIRHWNNENNSWED